MFVFAPVVHFLSFGNCFVCIAPVVVVSDAMSWGLVHVPMGMRSVSVLMEAIPGSRFQRRGLRAGLRVL